MSRKIPVLAFAALVVLALCATPLFAQSSQTSLPGTVAVAITARSSRGSAPQLRREDVSVREDRQARPVVSLTPLNGPDSPLQLVIFIDSSSTPQLGAQFDEISRFINALPQNASVALAYSANGSAHMDHGFTTDRATIKNALHLPMGPAVGNTDIYGALSDLIKKWPAAGQSREVLLISDGIDVTYGLFNTQPTQNPGLQQAIRDAQKNHIVVFSIFVSSGRATRNRFLNNNGQSSLNELTSSTGGYSFFQGTQTPVSFRPFLDDLQQMLAAQYLLTFRPAPASTSGLHNLKVTTEASGVKLLAPNSVYIPASQ